MDALWLHLVVSMVAGGAGAGLVLWIRGRRTPEAEDDVVEPIEPLVPDADSWSPLMWRCEQAVRRGAAAVESLSSREARNLLRTVLRRMDAELPDVRVLTELGKGLGDSGRDAEVAGRVRAQLAETAQRFTETVDRILELVAEPTDLAPQVAMLREEFPLVRPLSAVLAA